MLLRARRSFKTLSKILTLTLTKEKLFLLLKTFLLKVFVHPKLNLKTKGMEW
jgi:hypothetical protein